MQHQQAWPFGSAGAGQPARECFLEWAQIDGVPAREASRAEAVVTMPDGSVYAMKTGGVFVTAGDGTILGGRKGVDLQRLVVCGWCWGERRPLFDQQLETWSQAVIRASALATRVRWSDSGIPLCPRHQHDVETPEGRKLLTPQEAREFEDARVLSGPLRVLAKLLVK